MNGANKEKVLDKEMTLEKTVISKNEKPSQKEPVYKYKREDCEEGFLTDPDEIAEFMRRQQIDVYQNAMLGDYETNGEYSLPDEIADELLRSYKVITNNYENFIFAQTIRPIGEYGVAKFFITVSQVEGGLLATLTLVEPVHKMNRLITNAQSAQITSFIDKAGENFYYGMKKQFNIVDDDFIVPNDSDKFTYALRKKQQRATIWQHTLNEIEKIEKEIFEKRIQVLEKANNDYSKAVLAKFNEEFKKKQQYFKNAPNYNTCMNQLLDECINSESGVFPEQQKKAYKNLRSSIEKPVDRERAAIKNSKAELQNARDNSPRVHDDQTSYRKDDERAAYSPPKKEAIISFAQGKDYENLIEFAKREAENYASKGEAELYGPEGRGDVNSSSNSNKGSGIESAVDTFYASKELAKGSNGRVNTESGLGM